ncbi:hypothetical protein BSR05_20135 [Escherichia coli]|nr:hypothetical protein BSR05_20135 [Escherichia coli]
MNVPGWLNLHHPGNPDPHPAVMSMYHRQRFIAEVIRRYAALGKMADTITPRTPSRHPYAAE